MIFLDPSEQRPRIVQANVNFGVPLEDLHEWKVAARVGLLEDRVKISNGLMRMNEKD